METVTATQTNWIQLTHTLGKEFQKRAEENDKNGLFVFENYKQLKKHKFFSAAIPSQLGGAGLTHKEMCQISRTIGHYCGSTALAFSMHQHLIAAAVWKYKKQEVGEAMLRNVADHELILISTGARDWLGSNGELKKINGGYLFSAKKHFASQSAGGDVAVTSAPYENLMGEWKVLHFSVPMSTNGVSLADDWNVMGMRATGSHTIIFDQVFIPDSAVALERPRDEFHPVWNVVLTVALPLIMAAYVGIAEKAMEIALVKGKKYSRNSHQMPYMIGKINNALLSAQTQWKAMGELANNLDFNPTETITMKTLTYKTNVGDACKSVVQEAMEAIGGQSFYRANVLERLFRDVQASDFHPLPKWEQYAFTGKRILERD
jgi:alkylation response protein AidB-like acyl-CoA dehydrogenase